MRYNFLKSEQDDSARIPSLGVSGINLASLGSTASPNIPSTADITYDVIKDRGDAPIKPEVPKMGKVYSPSWMPNTTMGTQDTYAKANGFSSWSEMVAHDQVTAIENAKKKQWYNETALPAWTSEYSKWQKLAGQAWGGVENRVTSPVQRSGMMPGYSGVSGINV